MVEKKNLGSDRNNLSSLGGKTISGGLATALSQVVTTAISLIGLSVLARILAPADFGLIAKVAALTGIVGLVGDLGLSLATIQAKGITHSQLSTFFWINAALAIAIGASMALLSPLFSWFYQDPRVTGVTLGLAFNIFIRGFGLQHVAILRRSMDFGGIAVAECLAMLAGIIAAISTAPRLGYWSLLIQMIVSSTVATVVFWLRSGFRPAFTILIREVRDELKIGGNFTLSNVVNYFGRNGDNVLIAKFWGEGPVAFYTKAYSLLLLPLQKLNSPMSRVAVPALSRLQDKPEAYREFFSKGIAIAFLLQIPLAVFAAVAGREIILTVLGAKWAPSIPIFYALVPNLLMATTAPATQWVYLSRGDTQRLLKNVVVCTIVVICGFLIGLPYGPFGVACGFSITTVILRVPSICYCFHGSPLRVADFFRAMIAPGCCASIAAVMALLVNNLFQVDNPAAVLTLKASVFGIVYGVLSLRSPAGKDMLRRFTLLTNISKFAAAR